MGFRITGIKDRQPIAPYPSVEPVLEHMTGVRVNPCHLFIGITKNYALCISVAAPGLANFMSMSMRSVAAFFSAPVPTQ